jgi:hypothetical protein
MRHAEKDLFSVMRSQELDAYWQTLCIEPHRKRQAGDASQIDRQGEDILKIHRQRIASMFSQLEGGGRGNRTGIKSTG